MQLITFNKKKLKETIRSEEKPILDFDKIIFNTNDRNWTNRLLKASLTIKITGFNELEQEIKSFKTPLSLGAFITPYHEYPLIKLGRKIYFEDELNIILESSCAFWQTEIELSNLDLNEKEKLLVYLEEKETSSFYSLYQDFERIVKRILESNQFEVSYQGKKYDFLAVREQTSVYVEVKLYGTKHPNTELLRRACYKLFAQKDKSNIKLLLIVSNNIPEDLKNKIFQDLGITIWDIKTLLTLSTDFYDIRIELENILTKALKIPIDEFILREGPTKKAILEDLKISEAKTRSKPILEKEQNLCKELNNIKSGRDGAIDYENKCIEILKYLFNNKNDLGLWKEQLSSEDGLNRNDLLCKIISYENNFWAELSKDFHTRYIVFEFKNYTEKIKQGQIFTTEKYLFLTALRSVAFIVARNGADTNALKAAKGALKEAGKLIVILNNEDLCKMLKLKDNGDEPSIVLRERIDEMLITLNR